MFFHKKRLDFVKNFIKIQNSKHVEGNNLIFRVRDKRK